MKFLSFTIMVSLSTTVAVADYHWSHNEGPYRKLASKNSAAAPAEAAAPATTAHHAAAADAETGKASPAFAWNAITEGNKRFVTGNLKHGHVDPETRKKLAAGQKPHTIILSCSDSRVPPEIIFDQGLGDLFTVRVAGNVLGNATVASMEYAVEHLGAKMLVVMGHESCGAVKAAVSTPEGQSAGSPDLDSLVASIRPYVSNHREIATVDKTLRAPVKANVNGNACRLLQRSKIIREAALSGKIVVKAAIYGMEDGHVDFWDLEKDCWKD